MGENVKHFTSEQKDENIYGWPWNEVVKKYLESGYASEQKECQVTIREKEYKILKRDAVTVFYDADGNTLFDVTNDRLKKEYESDHGEEKETEDAAEGVEMGKASLADIITGNLPDPTPEEIEIAEKANAGEGGKETDGGNQTGAGRDPGREQGCSKRLSGQRERASACCSCQCRRYQG